MTEQGERFSLDDAISFAWKSTKKNFLPLLGIMFINFIITGAIGAVVGVQQMFAKHMDMTGFVIMFASGIIGGVLGVLIDLGMYNVQLRVCDELPIAPRDVFSVYRKFWVYLLASLIFHIARIIGFICLIVPGIIVHLAFQFYPFFILEEGLGPIQALKASHRITLGIKLDLLLFGIVLFFIDWVGGLLLLVGKIPAYMVCSLAKASVYRQLIANEHGGQAWPKALWKATCRPADHRPNRWSKLERHPGPPPPRRHKEASNRMGGLASPSSGETNVAQN